MSLSGYGIITPEREKTLMPTGRPPKLTDSQRAEVYGALEQYIRETKDPTIPGFISDNEIAIQYNINDSNLYDWQEFSVLIKRAVKKQESYLLKEGGAGRYNPTIAIFRLKQPQHGYKDRSEVDATVRQVTPIMSLEEDNAVSGNKRDQEG